MNITIESLVVNLPAAAATETRDVIERAMKASVSLQPAIGQLWPGQGGIYAGLMRGENGAPDYHLIVPVGAGYHQGMSWGAYGETEAGANSSLDGQANTAALVASTHDHPAAEWASAVSVDGHTDFYLPSRRELRLCWVNVPECFEDGWYWTSTQYSAHRAWYQLFDDGGQDRDGKTNEGRVRAVRRFLTT